MTRVAWRGGDRDWRWQCRSWFPFKMGMLDRTVQGESLDVLKKEVEAKLAQMDADFAAYAKDENSHFFSRDRYGHCYPYWPARHAANKRRQKVQDVLDAMSEKWGPTHTIAIDEEGRWLEDTVEVFCP